MIRLLGDIHGNFGVLEKLAASGSPIIQVGDFGVYPVNHPDILNLKLEVPVYFVEGNHEYHDFAQYDEPFEFARNLWYMPRGWVQEIGGRRIGFLGGAGSVDKHWRLHPDNPHRWWPSERILESEVERLVRNAERMGGVDLLVTHAPPEFMVARHFDPRVLVEFFNLPADWKDPSAQLVEDAWNALGKPDLICGHMHRSVVDGNVRILNINEVYEWR